MASLEMVFTGITESPGRSGYVGNAEGSALTLCKALSGSQRGRAMKSFYFPFFDPFDDEDDDDWADWELCMRSSHGMDITRRKAKTGITSNES